MRIHPGGNVARDECRGRSHHSRLSRRPVIASVMSDTIGAWSQRTGRSRARMASASGGPNGLPCELAVSRSGRKAATSTVASAPRGA